MVTTSRIVLSWCGCWKTEQFELSLTRHSMSYPIIFLNKSRFWNYLMVISTNCSLIPQSDSVKWNSSPNTSREGLPIFHSDPFSGHFVGLLNNWCVFQIKSPNHIDFFIVFRTSNFSWFFFSDYGVNSAQKYNCYRL